MKISQTQNPYTGEIKYQSFSLHRNNASARTEEYKCNKQTFVQCSQTTQRVEIRWWYVGNQMQWNNVRSGTTVIRQQ